MAIKLVMMAPLLISWWVRDVLRRCWTWNATRYAVICGRERLTLISTNVWIADRGCLESLIVSCLIALDVLSSLSLVGRGARWQFKGSQRPKEVLYPRYAAACRTTKYWNCRKIERKERAQLIDKRYARTMAGYIDIWMLSKSSRCLVFGLKSRQFPLVAIFAIILSEGDSNNWPPCWAPLVRLYLFIIIRLFSSIGRPIPPSQASFFFFLLSPVNKFTLIIFVFGFHLLEYSMF